ncbi:MAG: sulfite exporter TauE/SafE family protein [Alphaproteobacteria bacterium]|nr:sulfite exporter TauE/SafE family protein [Alphaproteobacteria bacterium]NNF25215.1 sulfite exporter TauE/SafE family protein [Paracoccaceae bacterium]
MSLGALATGDLIWLVAAALVAGLVRGFSGFGTAMVYLPVAGQVLSPFEALTTLIAMDIIGPLPNVPRALRDGNPADVLRLATGLLVALPFGVWALTVVPAEAFRYGVSLAALLLLSLLIAGVRYRGVLTPKLVFCTGGVGGLMAGSVGLPGPPVILLYMASPLPASAIRANITLYLILADIGLLAVLWLFGQLVLSAVMIGLLLILPYMAGTIAGAAIFRPEQEKTYRAAAYVIIAVSALSGLPVWD